MEDYEIGTQQIIRVNYDNISYELKYMGKVVQIKGNLSDGGIYIKDITVSFVADQRYISIDVSDYVEENIKYYPIFVAGDFVASHLEGSCVYISSIKAVRLICDGLATTGQGSAGNTLFLIPVTTEEDSVEGITNGNSMGDFAPYYSKAEVTELLADKQEKLVSGTNIKTLNNQSLLGEGNLSVDSLPSQSGQSGKFLTTDGSSASWDNIPSNLPSQSGKSGKFLKTDGTEASWESLPIATSVDSSSTDSEATGAKLFYDTCGDIETLINAL